MVAIAEMLACSDYDVVCLQEVWSDADFNLLRTKASGSLPYSHYFYRYRIIYHSHNNSLFVCYLIHF